jgi:hypothetical protein
MSKTRGEGRSSGEKGQSLTRDPLAYQKAKAKKQEEKDWAEKASPVVVRKIEKK